MTLDQIKATNPPKISVQEAAEVMGITPRFLQLALQQEKFNFGIAVKMEKWSYYINTQKFIDYMENSQARKIS